MVGCKLFVYTRFSINVRCLKGNSRARKQRGEREGDESERASAKNTIHCGNVFNIHLHAAHTHTHSQQAEYPKKGPLYMCIYVIYMYIYSVYYIYFHMTNIGCLVECQSPHTNSSIKLSRDQS